MSRQKKRSKRKLLELIYAKLEHLEAIYTGLKQQLDIVANKEFLEAALKEQAKKH